MAENLIEEYTSRITGSTQEASNSKSFIENFFLNLPPKSFLMSLSLYKLVDIHDTNLKDSEEVKKISV